MKLTEKACRAAKPGDKLTHDGTYGSGRLLRAFIENLQPRSVTVECVPGEDAAELFIMAVHRAECMQNELRAGTTVH
jgi:hypothetical protein